MADAGTSGSTGGALGAGAIGADTMRGALGAGAAAPGTSGASWAQTGGAPVFRAGGTTGTARGTLTAGGATAGGVVFPDGDATDGVGVASTCTGASIGCAGGASRWTSGTISGSLLARSDSEATVSPWATAEPVATAVTGAPAAGVAVREDSAGVSPATFQGSFAGTENAGSGTPGAGW